MRGGGSVDNNSVEDTTMENGTLDNNEDDVWLAQTLDNISGTTDNVSLPTPSGGLIWKTGQERCEDDIRGASSGKPSSGKNMNVNNEDIRWNNPSIFDEHDECVMNKQAKGTYMNDNTCSGGDAVMMLGGLDVNVDNEDTQMNVHSVPGSQNECAEAAGTYNNDNVKDTCAGGDTIMMVGDDKVTCVYDYFNMRCNVHDCAIRRVKISNVKWKWMPRAKKYGNVRVKVEKTICTGRNFGTSFSDASPSQPTCTAVLSKPGIDTLVGGAQYRDERESSGALDGDVNSQLKPGKFSVD